MASTPRKGTSGFIVKTGAKSTSWVSSGGGVVKPSGNNGGTSTTAVNTAPHTDYSQPRKSSQAGEVTRSPR